MPLANDIREVEGRIETTFAMLDRLIVEAGIEIARLEAVLDSRRQTHAPRATIRLPDMLGPLQRRLSPTDRRMVSHLAAAGFSVSEIARLLDRPVAQVAAALSGGSRAA